MYLSVYDNRDSACHGVPAPSPSYTHVCTQVHRQQYLAYYAYLRENDISKCVCQQSRIHTLSSLPSESPMATSPPLLVLVLSVIINKQFYFKNGTLPKTWRSQEGTSDHILPPRGLSTVHGRVSGCHPFHSQTTGLLFTSFLNFFFPFLNKGYLSHQVKEA
jgi:hypothetical protein